jgi:hypothetical protein
MITAGAIIMFICWAVGEVFGADMPDSHLPALLHVGYIAGLILVVVGVIVLLLGLITKRPILTRRSYWY